MGRNSNNPPIDLTMTAGLPYSRRIRVTGGANIWASTDEFEVRSQIRVNPEVSSTLKANLTPYLTTSIDNDDIIVDLELTGENTRQLPRGYYDMVLSDVGPSDARAIEILYGQIKIIVLVTAASDE